MCEHSDRIIRYLRRNRETTPWVTLARSEADIVLDYIDNIQANRRELKSQIEQLKGDLALANDTIGDMMEMSPQSPCRAISPHYEPPRPPRGTQAYDEWRSWKNMCGIWVEASGKCTPIVSMSDIHLETAIDYLVRKTRAQRSYHVSPQYCFPVLCQLYAEVDRRIELRT